MVAAVVIMAVGNGGGDGSGGDGGCFPFVGLICICPGCWYRVMFVRRRLSVDICGVGVCCCCCRLLVCLSGEETGRGASLSSTPLACKLLSLSDVCSLFVGRREKMKNSRVLFLFFCFVLFWLAATPCTTGGAYYHHIHDYSCMCLGGNCCALNKLYF